MKPLKNYYIKSKRPQGWTYTTLAEDKEEAVEHFHYHLRSYKFTKDQIREMVKEGEIDD